MGITLSGDGFLELNKNRVFQNEKTAARDVFAAERGFSSVFISPEYRGKVSETDIIEFT
jgi:hypothetical protein